VIYANQEQEVRFKKLFATALMRNPANPFACAREIETDESRVRQMAIEWPTDPDVAEYRRELLAVRGVAAQVPSKEEFAVHVYDELKTAPAKDRLAYMQFFARLMGFIDDKASGVNVNIGGGARIMPVPLAASDEEWERAAKAHQERLTAAIHG
jgi:hypothetical protein